MIVSDAKRLKDLELEQLAEELLAKTHLDIEVPKVAARGKG